MRANVILGLLLSVAVLPWPAALLLAERSTAATGSTRSPPYVDADGIAHLPALKVPPSAYVSAESRARLIQVFAHRKGTRPSDADIKAMRAQDEQKNAPLVARAQVLYPVNIEPRVIGGVRTQVITPKDGVSPRNRTRVLINLHGGGFIWGEDNGAKTESIPIAGLGKITVVAVAYRMAPEFKFPAASEDVAAVYRELLKDHSASDIGIYGCSAGGILTAESVAWFQQEQLPIPGAIGTFCGSAAEIRGDSSYLASPLVGEKPPKVAKNKSRIDNPYFGDASPDDPLVLPVKSEQVLERFPPTLLIAGSRDPTVSSLFYVQSALTKAGVEAELHVWDGMWHAFFMDPDLPESQEVYAVVVKFFDRHLGEAAAGARGTR